VAASTVPNGFDGSGSTSTTREVSTGATVGEKAAKMRIAEEATVAKVDEVAAAVKVAANKAAAMKAAKEVMVSGGGCGRDEDYRLGGLQR
jgi:hypothetical protein